jgi:hypothetical protein
MFASSSTLSRTSSSTRPWTPLDSTSKKKPSPVPNQQQPTKLTYVLIVVFNGFGHGPTLPPFKTTRERVQRINAVSHKLQAPVQGLTVLSRDNLSNPLINSCSISFNTNPRQCHSKQGRNCLPKITARTFGAFTRQVGSALLHTSIFTLPTFLTRSDILRYVSHTVIEITALISVTNRRNRLR